MKCAICNAEDDSVTHINTDCSTCQAVITDTILSYDKLDEDDEFVFVEYDDEMEYDIVS